MKTVRTPVDLEEDTFWKIAAVAEEYGMKVGEYLADLALLVSRREIPMEADPIVVRWRRGLRDKDIARELGLTNLAVATRRRHYNLPPNRRAA